MKKKIQGTCEWWGKPARVICTITDERGYISITADIIPYRCRTPHCCGCCHNEVAKAFPKLRKFLWLHLKSTKTFTDDYYIENTLYHLMNGNIAHVQETLHLTDAEMFEICAFVNYGLHKIPHKGYDGVYYTASDNTKEVFAKGIEKYNIPQRCKDAVQEFYKFVETL